MLRFLECLGSPPWCGWALPPLLKFFVELSLCSFIHSCCKSSSEVILFAGSHSRHLLITSTSPVSAPFIIFSIVLLHGSLRLPLEFVKSLGEPSSSKNFDPRVACFIKDFEGKPRTSMIQTICSASLSPGNKGYPVWSSAKMHPKLQISIAVV